MPSLAATDISSIVETAVRIRVFEAKLLELFQGGWLSGTVHTCIGQEFCAAALHPHLRKGIDAFFATHRGHGHYLAYGGPEDALLAELMGRAGLSAWVEAGLRISVSGGFSPQESRGGAHRSRPDMPGR